MKLFITVLVVAIISFLVAIYVDNDLLRAILVGLLVLVVGLFSKYGNKRE